MNVDTSFCGDIIRFDGLLPKKQLEEWTDDLSRDAKRERYTGLAGSLPSLGKGRTFPPCGPHADFERATLPTKACHVPRNMPGPRRQQVGMKY